MAEPSPPAQFIPRFRSDVYPFIAPSKFRGSLKDKVTIITGISPVPLAHHTLTSVQGLSESSAKASPSPSPSRAPSSY